MCMPTKSENSPIQSNDALKTSETSLSTPEAANSIMLSELLFRATTLTTVFIFLGLYLRSFTTHDRISCFIDLPSMGFSIDARSSGCVLVIFSTLAYIVNIERRMFGFDWITYLFSSLPSSLSRKGMAKTGSCGAFSALSRVTSADTFKNLSKNILSSLDSCSFRAALQVITRKECFARSDYIERLSINDVAILYQYSASINLIDFEKTIFLSQQTPVVKAVLNAMDMAVKVSRGQLSEGIKIVKDQRAEGDIDALYFVAATRIFAEWRNVRLVPTGYQRYAVGLSLAYRDVLQNLEKIERGVHDYLRHHQKLGCSHLRPDRHSIPAPTLRQLLQFELDLKLHENLPKVKEISSASGLLWTKRQLHYQVATLNNSLEVPEYYPTSKDAARAAYRIVYDEYHGWAVRQIFSQSFGGSPPLDKIWMTIDPPKDIPKSNTPRKDNSFEVTGHRFDDAPERKLSDVTDTTDVDKANSEDNQFLMALENFNHGLTEKWDDLLRLFNCGGEEKKKKRENLILSSESHFNLSEMDSISSTTASAPQCRMTSDSVIQERQLLNPIEKSKRDTEDFIREVSPLVADLSEMIDEFNMNDPSRV